MLLKAIHVNRLLLNRQIYSSFAFLKPTNELVERVLLTTSLQEYLHLFKQEKDNFTYQTFAASIRLLSMTLKPNIYEQNVLANVHQVWEKLITVDIQNLSLIECLSILRLHIVFCVKTKKYYLSLERGKQFAQRIAFLYEKVEYADIRLNIDIFSVCSSKTFLYMQYAFVDNLTREITKQLDQYDSQRLPFNIIQKLNRSLSAVTDHSKEMLDMRDKIIYIVAQNLTDIPIRMAMDLLVQFNVYIAKSFSKEPYRIVTKLILYLKQNLAEFDEKTIFKLLNINRIHFPQISSLIKLIGQNILREIDSEGNCSLSVDATAKILSKLYKHTRILQLQPEATDKTLNFFVQHLLKTTQSNEFYALNKQFEPLLMQNYFSKPQQRQKIQEIAQNCWMNFRIIDFYYYADNKIQVADKFCEFLKKKQQVLLIDKLFILAALLRISIVEDNPQIQKYKQEFKQQILTISQKQEQVKSIFKSYIKQSPAHQLCLKNLHSFYGLLHLQNAIKIIKTGESHPQFVINILKYAILFLPKKMISKVFYDLEQYLNEKIILALLKNTLIYALKLQNVTTLEWWIEYMTQNIEKNSIRIRNKMRNLFVTASELIKGQYPVCTPALQYVKKVVQLYTSGRQQFEMDLKICLRYLNSLSTLQINQIEVNSIQNFILKNAEVFKKCPIQFSVFSRIVQRKNINIKKFLSKKQILQLIKDRSFFDQDAILDLSLFKNTSSTSQLIQFFYNKEVGTRIGQIMDVIQQKIENLQNNSLITLLLFLNWQRSNQSKQVVQKIMVKILSKQKRINVADFYIILKAVIAKANKKSKITKDFLKFLFIQSARIIQSTTQLTQLQILRQCKNIPSQCYYKFLQTILKTLQKQSPMMVQRKILSIDELENGFQNLNLSVLQKKFRAQSKLYIALMFEESLEPAFFETLINQSISQYLESREQKKRLSFFSQKCTRDHLLYLKHKYPSLTSRIDEQMLAQFQPIDVNEPSSAMQFFITNYETIQQKTVEKIQTQEGVTMYKIKDYTLLCTQEFLNDGNLMKKLLNKVLSHRLKIDENLIIPIGSKESHFAIILKLQKIDKFFSSENSRQLFFDKKRSELPFEEQLEESLPQDFQIATEKQI